MKIFLGNFQESLNVIKSDRWKIDHTYLIILKKGTLWKFCVCTSLNDACGKNKDSA